VEISVGSRGKICYRRQQKYDYGDDDDDDDDNNNNNNNKFIIH